MKKKLIILAVLFVLAFSFLSLNSGSKQEKADSLPVTPIANNTFSHKGENGKDALSILKEKTTVEQNGTGLVVSINGKKADDKKREYWSFYVNGKVAEVGPSDFKTKDADSIEWKIETY